MMNPRIFVVNKSLDAGTRFVIGELLRRRLHEITRRPDERAGDTSIQRELGATNCIDDNAC